LESVLGATPREFESRILRHTDLRRCEHDAEPNTPMGTYLVSILVSIARFNPSRLRSQQPLLCLVTEATDGPDQDANTPRGVRPAETAELSHDRSICSRTVIAEDATGAKSAVLHAATARCCASDSVQMS
jgi:hypothetical protein